MEDRKDRRHGCRSRSVADDTSANLISQSEASLKGCGHMTSLRQIEANRQNALKSTGPKTHAGKQRSSRNAVRHGLTAETVIDDLEDADHYQAFQRAVASGFDAETTVERELVLRLTGVLWRLRRATAIEAGLLGAFDYRNAADENGFSFDREQNTNCQIALRFVDLAQSDKGAFERLIRYETALWRQVGQLLFTLDWLRRKGPRL